MGNGKGGGGLQGAEGEHAEDDDFLGALDLELFDVWHGEDEDAEIDEEVDSVGAHEELGVVDVAGGVGDGFVPVGGDGDTVQGDGDILDRSVSIREVFGDQGD